MLLISRRMRGRSPQDSAHAVEPRASAGMAVAWMHGDAAQIGRVSGDAFMLLPSQDTLLKKSTALCAAPVGQTRHSAPQASVVLEGMQVWPNPASVAFVLSVPDAFGEVELRITDMFGRTVWQYSGSEHHFTVPAGSLANGPYLVTCKAASGSRSYTKIIVQH